MRRRFSFFLFLSMLALSGMAVTVVLAQDPGDTPITTPLLAEGFEDVFPPSGWFTQNWMPTGAWEQTDVYTHSGTYSAYHCFTVDGMADSWLVTSQVTPTASSELVFWQYEKYAGSYYRHSVWVSEGSQDPKYYEFSPLAADLGPGPESEWQEVRLSLQAYADKPIFLAFRYQGDDADNWYVDDVQVTTGLAVANDSTTALGETTTLTASVAPGRGLTFTWALGDGQVATGPVVTNIYPAPGTYTAVVTTSNHVSVVTATTTVTIEETIAGLAATNDGPKAVGETTTIAASISGGSNAVYTWDLGDGSSYSGAVVTHAYSNPGPYTVVVTASNSVSVLTDTTVVLVDDPIAGLNATNDGPTALGDVTTLAATIADGSNMVYTWDLGDGTIRSGAAVTHIYPALGTYTAVVTASNSLGSVSETTTVQMKSLVYLPILVR